MRQPADLNRLHQFMQALGTSARQSSRVYLTGGATALLYGWRESTIDVDLKLVPERDELFRTIQELAKIERDHEKNRERRTCLVRSISMGDGRLNTS